MNEQKKYAAFSKASYKMNDPLKDKKTRMDEAMGVIEANGVSGFRMDKEETSSKRAVFVNDTTREVVISHRGTDPKLASNLSTDVALALGVEGLTQRYKNATIRDANTKVKYDGYDVRLTGHSLGGSISQHSAGQNGLKAVVYNSGSGMLNPSHFLRPKKQKRNVTHYSVMSDPLSFTSMFRPANQQTVARKTGVNPHALDNFL